MNETYTLRISRRDPILSEPEFVAWLKKNGHAVSFANDNFSSVNGVRDGRMGISAYSWAADVFSQLFHDFETTVKCET